MGGAFAGSRLGGRASASSTALAARASTRTTPSTTAGGAAAGTARVVRGRPGPSPVALRTSSALGRTGPAVAGLRVASIRCFKARPLGRPGARGPGGRPVVVATGVSPPAFLGAPISPVLGTVTSARAGRNVTPACLRTKRKPTCHASSPSVSASMYGFSGAWCTISGRAGRFRARIWSVLEDRAIVVGFSVTRCRR